MEVEIRGYKGYILNMVRHEIQNLYEIQLQAKGDIQIRLHQIKPEEIKISNKEEK